MGRSGQVAREARPVSQVRQEGLSHMRKQLIAVAAALLATVPALASGFSVYEQSAKASGQAGAWVARADDAAANWYNPAALVWLEGSNFHFGANLITIGRDTTLTSADPVYGLPAEGVKFDSATNNETPVNL